MKTWLTKSVDSRWAAVILAGVFGGVAAGTWAIWAACFAATGPVISPASLALAFDTDAKRASFTVDLAVWGAIISAVLAFIVATVVRRRRARRESRTHS
jgi:phage shock protein PspC (stress-responsive transcriptional regulator)